jgi:hypothetical protein
VPYVFHPMYATSSEHTRVPWAAHSYNIAFSDEIGHFEYCSGITDANFHLQCPATGGDPAGTRDADDLFCFGPLGSSRVRIGGCINTDVDFDGPEYFNNWPGTFKDHEDDREVHARPIRFTSPLFFRRGEEGEDSKERGDGDDADHEGKLENYGRVREPSIH